MYWVRGSTEGLERALTVWLVQGLALVIDGHSLGYALEDELRGDLLEISLVCRAGMSLERGEMGRKKRTAHCLSVW
jgi:hypothetical protein